MLTGAHKSLISGVFGLAVLLGSVRPAAAVPEPADGPCRVKLRTGRLIDATALQPVDDTRAFWRLDLAGGGSVVLPVRELKSVELLAREPEPVEVATVAAPPQDLEPVATCDPLENERLARWDALTAEAAERFGVDHALVRAVIAVESCGNPEAVSKKGAVGLMQLMPQTARDYGCSNPRDPRANVEAGVQHLARLLGKLGDIELVLAAYNAGEGAVAKAGGIPRFRETRDYVREVKKRLARIEASARATAAM